MEDLGMPGADILALSCAVLILIAGLSFTVRLRMGGWRRKVSSRIEQVTDIGDGSGPAEAPDDLFRILDSARGGGIAARLRLALREALRPVGGMKALRTIMLMSVLVGALGGFLGQRFLGLSPLVSAAIALVLAIATPIYYVSGQAKRQREKFLDNFPDAIDLIVRAVRAGIPTSESIVAAGREFGEPVGTEFARIGQEIAIGLTPDRALTEAAERIRISDFNFFVVTLILQRETGGNLAETLENLSSLLRKRREMRLKVRALTAEGRFTSKIISGLPFIIMLALFFLNKSYVTLLFTDPSAQTYLGIALGLIVVGSALLNRMIKLEV
jgi:Flp pilus assembly protein TadB